MNYELLKQLKKSGYTGSENWEDIGCVFKSPTPTPCLSELIEECKYGFRRLTLHHNKPMKQTHIDKYGEGVKWQANPNQHVSKVSSQWGKTPEEAVSKLWILLNK